MRVYRFRKKTSTRIIDDPLKGGVDAQFLKITSSGEVLEKVSKAKIDVLST